MIKEFRSNEELDFRSYAIEDSELLAVDWRPEIKEIELKFRLPVAGWQYREQWNKLLRSLRPGALISDLCVEYVVNVIFIGVAEVRETFLSEGHALLDHEPNDTAWIQSFILRGRREENS